MTGRREQKNFLRFNVLILCLMASLLVISYREDWRGLYKVSQQNMPKESEGISKETEGKVPQQGETAGQKESSEEMPELQVHYIDVGQADCTLLELDGRFLLIDAGEEGDAVAICNYLDYQGAYELDYVIGTHPHADHIGSIDVVIRQYDVGQILLPDVTADTSCYRNMMEAMSEKDLDAVVPQAGDVYAFGGALFQILGPSEIDSENGNNNSIAIKLTYGDTSFLFAGDAEREEERDLCSSGIDLSADVLKVNHHGSSSSTSEEFLALVEPEYAVISCGLGNEYGHPAAQTLNRLEEYGVSIFRTDTQGDIVAASNGKEITWSVEPSN